MEPRNLQNPGCDGGEEERDGQREGLNAFAGEGATGRRGEWRGVFAEPENPGFRERRCGMGGDGFRGGWHREVLDNRGVLGELLENEEWASYLRR